LSDVCLEPCRPGLGGADFEDIITVVDTDEIERAIAALM